MTEFLGKIAFELTKGLDNLDQLLELARKEFNEVMKKYIGDMGIPSNLFESQGDNIFRTIIESRIRKGYSIFDDKEKEEEQIREIIKTMEREEEPEYTKREFSNNYKKGDLFQN